jgi:hypothetical protein
LRAKSEAVLLAGCDDVDRFRECTMLVGLPKAAIEETAEFYPQLPVVLLFCLSGLTLSFLLHLLPLEMVDAMSLLASVR